MRLPSACATSVPFCARHQFSRVSLSGEKDDYIWKFLGGFFRFQSSKTTRQVSEDMALSGESSTVDLASETTKQDNDPGRSSDDASTPRQELGTANRSHSEFEGGVSSLLWRRRY